MEEISNNNGVNGKANLKVKQIQNGWVLSSDEILIKQTKEF